MYNNYQDREVRQPLVKTPNCCYKEDLFIQPDKRMTTLNSDNVNSTVQLVDSNDMERVYSNHALTGKAHPRTKIAPIVPARSLDLDYWKDTPMTSLSIVNKRKKQYPNLAGYNITELVDRECLECPNDRKSLGHTIKASPLVQTIQPGVYTLPTTYDPINTDFNIGETTQFEPVKQNYEWGNVVFTPISAKATQKLSQQPADKQSETVPTRVESDNAIPTHSSVPKRLNANKMKNTSPPPTKPQVQPVSIEAYEPEERAPNMTSKYQVQPELGDDVSIYNTFDPRFSGYGSDNRSYMEPMLRQTRYYYDDVNAIRMPNYIVRSKIDNCVTGFGDQYGPMRVDQRTLNENRPLAEQAYLDNNLAYRNNLMESLMRKRNSELWQTRQAPMYTQRRGLK
jgi:hypothetical protein